MTARVIPFPGVVLADMAPVEPPPPPLRKEYTCAVCGVTNCDAWNWRVCDTCGAYIHSECYWGRVASLDEWRTWARWLPESDLGEEFPVPTTCPTCRAAKDGA